MRLPEWCSGLRPAQEQAIAEVVDAFAAGHRFVVLDGPTGCLAGDTRISVNRAGNQRWFTIAELVRKFNGGSTPKGRSKVLVFWRDDIPTMVQRAIVVPKYGLAVGLVPLVRAIDSGVRTTYTLRTRDGRAIRATADHRFALDGGAMVPLSALSIGDELLVDGGKGKKKTHFKPQYQYVQGLLNHPQKGAWPYRQPMHRLVVEAEKNGLRLDWYIAILRDRAADVSSLFFLSPEDAVHHVNHDPLDNRRENLEVHEHHDHHRLHAFEGAWVHVANRVVTDVVESIERFGEEPTYDLTVADDPHNFVANEFVVENSGKSLIGTMVPQVLETRAAYLCSTKSLQRQLVNDFPDAALIMGRSNFPTADEPERFGDPVRPLDASDCTKERVKVPACGACPDVGTQETKEKQPHCQWCHPSPDHCPYEIAKGTALRNDLIIANVNYFLSECNGPARLCGGIGPNGHAVGPHGRGLVVTDEVDTAEDTLLGHAEVYISARKARRWGLRPPDRKTVAERWPVWVSGYALEHLERVRAKIPRRDADVKALRERKSLTATIKGLRAIDFSTDNWVYQGSDADIRFKPVRVDGLAEGLLWRHGRRHLLMSGTVISPQNLAETLGIESYAYVEMPSTFAAVRRPVIVRPVADMSRKATLASERGNYATMGAEIVRILADHPGDRVLVHAVSYALTTHLVEFLSQALDTRLVVGYKTAREREDALAKFRATTGAVLVAPSLDRGIDLADDDCRVVIVAKVPFPDLGDKQVAARLYGAGGRSWYSVATIRSVVQMTGRAMRHEGDHMTAYVLDSQFATNVWRKDEHLFPRWFRDAVDLTGGVLTQRRRAAAAEAG